VLSEGVAVVNGVGTAVGVSTGVAVGGFVTGGGVGTVGDGVSIGVRVTGGVVGGAAHPAKAVAVTTRMSRELFARRIFFIADDLLQCFNGVEPKSRTRPRPSEPTRV
jgi:hypothetical protein